MPLPKADLVLRNGRIWCGLESGFVESVAVWRGRVLATGRESEIEALVGPATRRLDLAGRLAIPAFNDNHMHLLPLGLSMVEVDIRATEVRTMEALLGRIKAAADQARPGEWVVGRGYDHFEFDLKRHPLREELDQVAPRNPVYIKRTCGHVGVANSLALQAGGVVEESPNPQGGALERQNGRLTGLLMETAQRLVSTVIPKPSLAALVDGIERAGKMCAGYGIASVMDANVGARCGMDEIAAYETARRLGRLPVRTYMCLAGGPAGIVEASHARGLVTKAGDDMLKVGPVKVFTDGSAGGRTAAMYEPYVGGDEHDTGILVYKDEDVREMVLDYHSKGYQMALHGIGDHAIQICLDAVENAQRRQPAADRRHRIEHCGFMSDAQIDQMARLGMSPAPQPVFMYDFGDLYISVLGEERSAVGYPMRRWTSAGVRPAASTDSPVCSADPFVNLYATVTRKTSRGTVLGGQERLNVGEALHAMTANGAYVSFCEQDKGTLEPGMLADIAVLSRDVFTCDPEAIRHDTRCDLTLRGGVVSWDRHQQLAA
ncbi:amidohydrolase [Allostella vacuolata]|nr:amidohydrolase [Stella vacuolata]